MTTQKLPGSEAARHGSGDADLTIMLAAHEAFRRHLVSLARATLGQLPPPVRLLYKAVWKPRYNKTERW